jgi:ankyrin repeat protein
VLLLLGPELDVLLHAQQPNELLQLLRRNKTTDKNNELLRATKAGDLATMKSLLADGVNVNHQTTKNRYTALHYASYDGFNDGVRLLLAYDADIKLTNHHSETAANAAAAGDHHEISKMLAGVFSC